jgi:hypothetical protein
VGFVEQITHASRTCSVQEARRLMTSQQSLTTLLKLLVGLLTTLLTLRHARLMM